MILVDTSIWIEFLAAKPRRVTCGPIVEEVLQGLRPGPQRDSFRKISLEIPCLSGPGRRQGITIRSSADCLIAAIARYKSLEAIAKLPG
jgi:predicted nucleic acid-binding protein